SIITKLKITSKNTDSAVCVKKRRHLKSMKNKEDYKKYKDKCHE
ncbi:14453_t:CDS:1, partial [Racocetra persica]